MINDVSEVCKNLALANWLEHDFEQSSHFVFPKDSEIGNSCHVEFGPFPLRFLLKSFGHLSLSFLFSKSNIRFRAYQF